MPDWTSASERHHANLCNADIPLGAVFIGSLRCGATSPSPPALRGASGEGGSRPRPRRSRSSSDQSISQLFAPAGLKSQISDLQFCLYFFAPIFLPPFFCHVFAV